MSRSRTFKRFISGRWDDPRARTAAISSSTSSEDHTCDTHSLAWRPRGAHWEHLATGASTSPGGAAAEGMGTASGLASVHPEPIPLTLGHLRPTGASPSFAVDERTAAVALTRPAAPASVIGGITKNLARRSAKHTQTSGLLWSRPGVHYPGVSRRSLQFASRGSRIYRIVACLGKGWCEADRRCQPRWDDGTETTLSRGIWPRKFKRSRPGCSIQAEHSRRCVRNLLLFADRRWIAAGSLSAADRSTTKVGKFIDRFPQDGFGCCVDVGGATPVSSGSGARGFPTEHARIRQHAGSFSPSAWTLHAGAGSGASRFSTCRTPASTCRRAVARSNHRFRPRSLFNRAAFGDQQP